MSTPRMSTPNLGTGAMEDRDRIHFADLRRARRQKMIEEMAGRELDAMVLGREGNVRYASGARRLWTAQSRPFSPTCAVIRATNRVELMSFSASYEGMPEDVQPADFFAVTWNPGNFVERFAAIPELHDARRVGFDGLSPFFEGLMRQAFPQAEFIGAEDMMRQLRRRKLEEEILCSTVPNATVAALVAAGWLVHDDRRNVYGLGPALVGLGDAAASVCDVIVRSSHLARPAVVHSTPKHERHAIPAGAASTARGRSAADSPGGSDA